VNPLAHPRRSILGALAAAVRPKQCLSKNLLVFAALLFTLDARHHVTDFRRSGIAFVIFCALSGATYIINDIMDVDSDRHHPTKCRRPIAAGDLSPRTAAVFAAFLIIVAAGAALTLGPAFEFGASAYLVLTVSYSLWVKHIVLLDLLFLASGFVLRAMSGAWAIHVSISSWLILCTLLLALFLGIAKRRAELIAVLGGRKVGRVVIGEYSAELLDQMSTIVTSALLMSYALYTIQSDAAIKHHYLLATIPFVLYGIFRYLYLVHKRSMGESPDEVVFRDRPLLACIVLWAIVTGAIVLHQF
jgi:4-hydroxybenzoate polyprenyltransferase